MCGKRNDHSYIPLNTNDRFLCELILSFKKDASIVYKSLKCHIKRG